MKVLWSSNAPWVPSGYGQQTKTFVHRIRDMGHDIALLAFFGLMGDRFEWEGIHVYPGGQSPWANDVLVPFALDHFDRDPNAGYIITLQDVWTFSSEAMTDMHVASWVPVDHDPCPPGVAGFFVRTGAVPIAMSRFGQYALEYQNLESLYVPHGIETDIFAPKPKAEREAIREQFNIPNDAFVVGMVAANAGNTPPRKSFPEVFQAFAQFKQRRSSALLFLHTRTRVHGGLDLPYLASNFGIEDDIIWVDQSSLALGKIAPQDMAIVYSVFDVLVNPSYGEGFGIPIVEAQACGVPVIVANNTAMPELVDGGGWIVPCTPFWDEHQRSFFGRPEIAEIEAALEKAYHASGKVREAARAKALEYDASHVAETYWKPALERLEGMLAERQVDPIDLGKLRERIESNGQQEAPSAPRPEQPAEVQA